MEQQDGPFKWQELDRREDLFFSDGWLPATMYIICEKTSAIMGGNLMYLKRN